MTDQVSPKPTGQESEGESEQNAGQEPQPVKDGEGKTFSEDYVKSLRAEAATHRTKAQDALARVEELEGRDKSEAEKLSGKLAKAEARAQAAESQLLRYEVAQEKAVPPEAVELLTGADRASLEANADKLLALIEKKEAEAKPPPPELDGGAREPAPEQKTPEEAHNELIAGIFSGTTPNT